MKKRYSIICFILLLSAINFTCKNNEFPEVKKLSDFTNTVFIAYPEKTEMTDKNVIYAASFLFAWDEIKRTLNNDIDIDKNQYEDLYDLNASCSHYTTLNQSEYTSNVIISDQIIRAKAYFKKTLSFEKEFETFDNSLNFTGDPVKSFGLWGDDDERSFMVNLLHYENDDDFIIKLIPEDVEHEIILYKPKKSDKICLSKLMQEVKAKIDTAETDKKNALRAWRYQFENDDKLEIPKIMFNIETNYSEFEHATLISSGTEYEIISAFQRTAFVLNEKGAIVESEAEVDMLSAPPFDEEIPEPKALIFDKPFFIILKRVDCKKAYFMMWVANSDLMEK